MFFFLIRKLTLLRWKYLDCLFGTSRKRQWLQVALAVRNPAVHFFARPPRGIHGFTLQPPVFQHCHSHVSFEVSNIGVKFFMGRELFLPRPQSVNVFVLFERHNW